MPFKKGQSGNPKGRKQGQRNKTSREALDNIITVFEALGGAPAMAEWAKNNPDEFYKIYRGLLPVQSGPGTAKQPFQGELTIKIPGLDGI